MNTRRPLIFTGVVALAACMALGACTTLNPYTGQPQTSNVTKGAAIGAVGGAVAGALIGGGSARKRALLGAGVGALTGAGIGYYMDVQEAKLRQQLQGTGVSVTRNGNDIVLNMPGNITFQTNSSQLNPAFTNVLHSVTLVLKEYNKTLIDVDGFTDSTGSPQYNLMLSQLRAQAVADNLEAQGILPARIAVQGFGEANPIASNNAPEGRAQNRRVELHLAPLTAN
ncbi:MAG TPA: OmpA family protein [Gammaproteobacteria bacterium]|nr:OmpA family protein [Gammaproteobacteria bacterium]